VLLGEADFAVLDVRDAPDRPGRELVLGLILVVLIAALVVGYRKVAAASSPQAANGVLIVVLAVGAAVWLLDNLTL
jgi:hypothetical protein